MKLSNYLRESLNQRKWNLSDLARRAGASPGTVSKWVSGTRTPDFLNCMKLALAFKDNLIDVLILASHKQKAEILKGFLPDKEQRDEIPLHRKLRKELEVIIEEGDEEALEAINRVLNSINSVRTGLQHE